MRQYGRFVSYHLRAPIQAVPDICANWRLDRPTKAPTFSSGGLLCYLDHQVDARPTLAYMDE
jgi:hypothetical protein